MAAAQRHCNRQRGFTLVEVLVSVLIFTIGILGLVEMQASAIKFSTDADQRAQATFLADQLLARMLIADPTTAADFAHNPAGAISCAPSVAPSTNPIVVAWLGEVTAAFPLATADQQQIVVTGVPANEVTVTLCWQNSARDAPHRLEVSNRVQWP